MHRHFSPQLFAPALVAFAFTCSPMARAATAQRTFVASNGGDANACSVVAPCRSFGAAIAKTTIGGEVIVMDSAGYGTVTIGKSISIIAPTGVYAGITVPTGDGITIATPGIDVVLSGLTINGLGGANGIHMIGGSSLRIENCTVSGFTASATAAINIGAAAEVVISDTVAARSNIGIVLDGGATVTIARVKAVNNVYHGIAMVGSAEGTTTVSVSDSVISNNTIYGIVVTGTSTIVEGGFSPCAACVRKMSVSNSVVDGNGSGLVTVGSSITASNNVISHNTTYGLAHYGGTLRSAQNNVLANNPAPTGGTITTGGIVF